MLNYVWLGMLIIGFIIGIMNGKTEQVTKALIDSSSRAVEISIGLLGITCLWTGLMNIAEKSGLVNRISKAVRPVLKYLFPGVPTNHPAMGAIIMNLTANFLGLGNAATPLGLKAMGELQRLNPRKDTATDEMSMFLILNTCCIQLIPTTIIAIRSACGSKNPAEIMSPIWFVSVLSAVVGISLVRIFSIRIHGRRLR